MEEAHPLWQWGVFLSLLVLLTGLGYHLVELPMIRLGARMAAPASQASGRAASCSGVE
jgi:peptidoglycan/LPS O-acetylase OafA/YrhL